MEKRRTMRNTQPNEKTAKAAERAERRYHLRYYDRDALIITHANRNFVLALGSIAMALLALGYAMYIGRQPATVIKVTEQGEAVVLSPTSSPGPTGNVRMAATEEDRLADDLERMAFIRQFLLDFEHTDPDTAEKQIANAINMMTENLKVKTLDQLRQRNVVGNIKKKRTVSKLTIKTIEQPSEDKFQYLIIANKRLHYFEAEKEIDSAMVMKYTIRLVPEQRTVFNPHGLRIYDFSQQVVQETSG
jgi:type IV secretory pathway TrbF-like protein